MGRCIFLPPLQSARAKSPSQFTESKKRSKKREEFGSFLEGVLADRPPDREIHVIVDHSSPPKRNDDRLGKFQGRVVFRLLQRKTLHGGKL
jgi:hypothetical protein